MATVTQGPRVSTKVPIAGMTCKACEARVGKLLRRADGVREAKVSLAKGSATVVSDGPVPVERLDAALAGSGYRVAVAALPVVSSDRAVWRDALLGAAAMALVLWGGSALGLTGLTDRLDGSAGGFAGVALAFALGVIASLSTCMALVGGLVLSLTARFAQAHPDLPAGKRLRPQVMFNLGRVAGFAALGAVLGAVGGAFRLSGHLLALAMVAVALVMGVLGLKLSGVSPRLSRVSITLPASWTRWTGRAEASGTYRDSAALALGAASFFLPCGFTQAVQVYALSTGNPLQAGLLMGAFAVGTAPGLLGIGALGSLATGRAAARVFRFAGVAVCAFALVNLVGATQILRPAWFAPKATVAATVRSENVTDDGAVQVLSTVQDGRGYTPNVATVYAGRPVRWEVDSQGWSCASTMNLEAMGLGVVGLDTGMNVFEFTPEAPGTLAYTCGMGMYPARIDVIEAPA
ncbi:MAG: sulfite exporter TauE/SafE family protein [Bifidobacteriaceae bacterium]|jgi:sulfite exporter TauE/SafE/copper chaperone CopZ|nr:sulfite exporter TauE/SafE family protein [Bifidobacteriaceae bacterium]